MSFLSKPNITNMYWKKIISINSYTPKHFKYHVGSGFLHKLRPTFKINTDKLNRSFILKLTCQIFLIVTRLKLFSTWALIHSCNFFTRFRSFYFSTYYIPILYKAGMFLLLNTLVYFFSVMFRSGYCSLICDNHLLLSIAIEFVNGR